ncbi:TIGR01244 family sulfur transferase [Pelagibacterium sp. 26DY04]|uniref:TIGR01244 family sulfur transferase n=1 Tax=Pelagibacterium sp. 26DY04 TaxID=2967130 RepID=UPI0028152F73|nr:TIGR01244 family sulfur transferase [Pelagibacterium sp. 26DY04]WMT86210.1 TIGR01244 family sulfur transferase [Pelagibacterium sp. 26DY04]
MNIKTINDRFATTGQVHPSDIEGIKAKGFVGIVCARPDNEEAGQPAYSEVAAAAQKAGLKAVHIPVSGPLGEGQIIQFEQAMAEMDGPVLGYCRSGARAGSLYATLNR